MNNKMLDKRIKRYYNLYKIQNLDKSVYAMNEEINTDSSNKSKVKRHKLMQSDTKIKEVKYGTTIKTATVINAPDASEAAAATPSAPSTPMGGGGGGY